MKRHKILYYYLLIFLFLSSCEEKVLTDFVIRPQEDMPIKENPIIQAQALDGDTWIDGNIVDKNITFEFRQLEQSEWNNISVRFVTDENTEMVDPGEYPAKLDLSQGGIVVKATNGYTPVEYSLAAKVYPLLKSIEVSVGTEIIKQVPSTGTIQISFLSAGINEAVVKLELNEDVTLVHPTNIESIQNLSQPLEIQVKDNQTQKTISYILKATSDWSDVSETISTMGIQIPSYMTVYKNTKLHGRDKNTGYIVKIPAGDVKMKTSYSEKQVSTWFENNQKVGDVISTNRDYSLFVGGVGLQYWKPMIRPNVVNQGAIEYEGNLFWNIPYYTTPPTLGVKNGQASISYAETLNSSLYKFQNPQNGAAKSSFTSGQIWDVDAAISGYAMPLQGGMLQVTVDSEAGYKPLANKERNFVFSTVNGMVMTNVSINIDGTNMAATAALSDAQRMARTLMGTTEDGGLIIFVSERYASTTNLLIDPANYASDGSTLLEAAATLKELGCTDAIALHQSNFAVLVLQNQALGYDLTKTVTRSDGNDLTNSTLIMFK